MPNTTFNFDFNRAYTASVEFNTLVDEKFTGREQRRDTWTNPRRKWILEMEKDKIDREAFVNFFIAMKGQKHSFDFVWRKDRGGDDQTYRVRFASDKLDMDILELGYSSFKIELAEVFE